METIFAIANDLRINIDLKRTTVTENDVCVYVLVNPNVHEEERRLMSSAFHISLLDAMSPRKIHVFVCDDSPHLLAESLTLLYRYVIALYPWRLKPVMESLVTARVLQSIQNVQTGTPMRSFLTVMWTPSCLHYRVF